MWIILSQLSLFTSKTTAKSQHLPRQHNIDRQVVAVTTLVVAAREGAEGVVHIGTGLGEHEVLAEDVGGTEFVGAGGGVDQPGGDDDVVEHRHVVGDCLRELFAIRRSEDDLVIVTLGLQRADGTVDGFALHHHAGKAPVGVVVHAPPFVKGVVSEVVEVDFCQAFLLCPGQDGLVYEAFEHFGQDGDDVNSHFGFLFCRRYLR